MIRMAPSMSIIFEGGDMGDMDDILKNIFGGSFAVVQDGAATAVTAILETASTMEGSIAEGSIAEGSTVETSVADSREVLEVSIERMGSDTRAEIDVTFDEAAFGADKIIHLTDPNNGGRETSLKVHIPAGIDNGKSIRLKGKGMPGINGGKSGDLLLK